VDLSSLNKRKLLCVKIVIIWYIKAEFYAQNTWDEIVCSTYPAVIRFQAKGIVLQEKQLKFESGIFMRSYKYYVCPIL
jgi:hypothetical protein